MSKSPKPSPQCICSDRPMKQLSRYVWRCIECGSTWVETKREQVICGECNQPMDKAFYEGMRMFRCVQGHELWTYEQDKSAPAAAAGETAAADQAQAEDEEDGRDRLAAISPADIRDVMREDRSRGFRKGRGGKRSGKSRKKTSGQFRRPYEFM